MMLPPDPSTAAAGAVSVDATVLTVVVVVCTVLALASAIDIARRPARLALGGRRWPWVLVVLLLAGLGWALYLLFGRLSEQDLIEQEEFAASDPA